MAEQAPKLAVARFDRLVGEGRSCRQIKGRGTYAGEESRERGLDITSGSLKGIAEGISCAASKNKVLIFLLSGSWSR